jgi:hypothetical protein
MAWPGALAACARVEETTEARGGRRLGAQGGEGPPVMASRDVPLSVVAVDLAAEEARGGRSAGAQRGEGPLTSASMNKEREEGDTVGSEEREPRAAAGGSGSGRTGVGFVG